MNTYIDSNYVDRLEKKERRRKDIERKKKDKNKFPDREKLKNPKKEGN